MPAINKEDYVLRVANATPVQLVVINHELLLAYLSNALEAHDANDTVEFDRCINNTKDALQQLIDGLDFKIEIAQDLYDLYLYAGERLNKAFFARDKKAAAEVHEMFTKLLDGWSQIQDTPDDRVKPEAVPQIYAGLTYDGSGLSEVVIQDEGRGYKV